METQPDRPGFPAPEVLRRAPAVRAL